MGEKKYIASRISEGNRLFPAEIHLNEAEVVLKFPGFFSGKYRHIVYQQIEGINIDTPMIGYSTITFIVGGERLTGHGFTKADVNEIKSLCSEKIAARSSNIQTEIIANAISNNNKSEPNKKLSVPEELRKFKELLDEGIITQEEFELQKAKILARY